MVMPSSYEEMDADDKWMIWEQRPVWYDVSGLRSEELECPDESSISWSASDPIMAAFVVNAVLDMMQNPVWLGSPPTDSISGCMSQPLWIPSPLGKQDLEDDSNSFSTP